MLATSGNESILSFLRRAFQNPVRGSSPHSSPKLHGMARLGNWTDKKKRVGAATVVAPGVGPGPCRGIVSTKTYRWFTFVLL